MDGSTAAAGGAGGSSSDGGQVDVGTEGDAGETSGDPASGASSAGDASGDDGTASAGSAGGESAGAAAGANRDPIILGLLNNESGVGANVTQPVREVWQAWAKSVNARGGIKGHPVQVLVADCANNTSLNVPRARDLVENQRAIALSFECGEITGVPEYATSKRIPVVGTLIGHKDWNENPLLFPTKSNSPGVAKANGRATKEVGAKKVAILYCAEAPICKQGAEAYAAAVKENGMEVVYIAGTTVTQPDYTSECLQARNAGADTLYVGGLPDQAIRVARSCSRQQYKPIFIAAPSSDGQTQIAELDKMVSFAGSFPWFLYSGSAALEEYGQALKKYAPRLVGNGTSLQTEGWLAAKVFERAAEHGFSPDKAPSSADLLNGLWAMKNETLGGLAPGALARTFVKDRPTPDVSCTYVMKLQGGKWTGNADPICL